MYVESYFFFEIAIVTNCIFYFVVLGVCIIFEDVHLTLFMLSIPLIEIFIYYSWWKYCILFCRVGSNSIVMRHFDIIVFSNIAISFAFDLKYYKISKYYNEYALQKYQPTANIGAAENLSCAIPY